MQAVEQVTADASLHTRDLGGKATTRQVTDAVRTAARAVRRGPGRARACLSARCRSDNPQKNRQETSRTASPGLPPRARWPPPFLPPSQLPGPRPGRRAPSTSSCRFPQAAPQTCWHVRWARSCPRVWASPWSWKNPPGAGATLGADHVAKAKPDGYTLLMGAVHHTIATSVYRRLGYDFQKDLAPITVVAVVPNVLVVNPQVPAKTVQELLAQARAQPGKLAYGSNGAGTGQHLIGAQFESMGGVQLLHVPYKGSGPLTTDLLGGQIAMSFDTVTPVLPHIKAGKLRAGRDFGPALGGPARCAHAGRGRAQGLRHGHLVRRAGTGRHAPRGTGAAGRGHEPHHRVPAVPQEDGRDRRRAHRRIARADGAPDSRRHRPLRQAGQGRQGGPGLS
ncbi:Chloride channel protein 1 [Manis javanica]|nr:Chloride channel protein 1 [Manis javanica]